MSDRVDLLVVGAGQAGPPLAREFAAAQRPVVLVERDHVGGTCINDGCTPTKTMVASARVAALIRRGREFGVGLGDLAVDLPQVRARKQAMVDRLRDGLRGRLEQTEHLELLDGTARFVNRRTLAVKPRAGRERTIEADLVVLDTGCRPARPPIPGLDEVPVLDSTSIMELGEVPRRLLVIGGGPIALEFGQMFRRFGSLVTILERDPRLLMREDEDVSAAVSELLAGDGIDVVTAAEITRVGPGDGATVQVTFRQKGATRSLQGSHLLVATGRVPNTEDLDLAAGGVEVDRHGFIRVDERLATSAPGVYATGDVTGAPQFTHISYDHHRILRDNLLRGGQASTRDRLVPWTVFLDPELAHVGLREREARDSGRPYRVTRMPMTRVARALEMDEARGFMKAIVDPGTRRILGFTVLGVSGGELMAVVEMAILAGLPYSVLEDAIFVHPTLAESLNTLFATLE